MTKPEDPPAVTRAVDILMLEHAANQPDLARTMRVLKMRGSKHATEQHRLQVDAIPREAV